MGTRSGELREMLVEAIEAVRKGNLDPAEAKAIAALAGQINLSLQVELNARANSKNTDAVPQLGHLQLGDERSPSEPIAPITALDPRLLGHRSGDVEDVVQ
jgi:hypothetical protein